MKKWLSIIAVVTVVVVTSIVLVYRLHRPTIPASITKQAAFVLFYPKGDSNIVINQATFKYDKALNQFSFVAVFNGARLTFGEQATPQTFYASSEYYANLITKMGSYYTFQNANGTVNLTQASRIGHQAGVMNAKGTLLFIESGSNLSNDNWREIFNSLSYVQGG